MVCINNIIIDTRDESIHRLMAILYRYLLISQENLEIIIIIIILNHHQSTSAVHDTAITRSSAEVH